MIGVSGRRATRSATALVDLLPRSLPSLDGRRGAIVRASYIALLILTLPVLCGNLVATATNALRDMPAAARFGFAAQSNFTFEMAVTSVTGSAAAAGLRVGDIPLAIDGIPLASRHDLIDLGGPLAAKAEVQIIDLQVSRGSKRLQAHLHNRGSPWFKIEPQYGLPSWVLALLWMIDQPALLLFAASFVLWLRRPHDPAAMLFAFAFLLENWTYTGLSWLPIGEYPRLLLGHLGSLGQTLMLVAVAAFPDGKMRSLAARLAALAGLLLELTSLYARATNGGLIPHWIVPIFFAASSCIIALDGAALALRYRQLHDGAERQQIKWAVAGFCVTGIGIVLFYLFAGWMQSPNNWCGGVVALLIPLLGDFGLPLGLLISLMRYRLYDAERAIGISVSYGLLTVALVAMFAGSEKVIELLGEKYFGARLGAFAGGLGAAVATVMIVPLHHRVSHWAEHRFQKQLVHLRHDLPALIGDLRETETIATIGEAIVRQASHDLRAYRAAMIEGERLVAKHGATAEEVADWQDRWKMIGNRPLEIARADPIFPVRLRLATEHRAEAVGWLLLGPRPDGSVPGPSERAVLLELAEPIARAVQTVRRREEREARHERRLLSLETELTHVHAELERVCSIIRGCPT